MSEPIPSTPQPDRPPKSPVNRRLWTSPAISDYFSGDDASTWSFSPEASILKSTASLSDAPRASSPDPYGGRTLQNSIHGSQLSQSSRSQRQLLQRLNSVGRSILSSDFDDDQCIKLGVDIDRMESTIAAPDSQSREPAEDEVTGLFNDDATETSTVVQEPSLNDREALALVRRVTMAASDLRQRFLEIKHTNDIATTKLEAAAHEISHLRKQNEELRNNDSQSEILYLRLRLNALEERAKSHLDRRGQEDLLTNIGQLNLGTSPQSRNHDSRSMSIRSTVYSDDVFVDDSRASDGLGYRIMRSHSSTTSSRKLHSLSTGSVYTNGQVTPIAETNHEDQLLILPTDELEVVKHEEVEMDSPVLIEAAEALAMALLNDEKFAEQQIASEKQDSAVEVSDEEVDGPEDIMGKPEVIATEVEPDEVQEDTLQAQFDIEEVEVNDELQTACLTDEVKEDAVQQMGKHTPQKIRRSPWQMLWDDLAEFAGIHNEYEDDEGHK